jgi:hypothetical protein
MICFMPWGANDRFSSVFFWLFLFFGWFLALPGTLGLFAVVNRSMSKAGDYFRVDMPRRTLELCRAGRTIKGDDIIAVTLLNRWYRVHYVDGNGPWTRIYQTGVLVRAPDNRVEFCPVVCQTGENVPSYQRSRWADRLASIFQVAVRSVELSRTESRALNDC